MWRGFRRVSRGDEERGDEERGDEASEDIARLETLGVHTLPNSVGSAWGGDEHESQGQLLR